MQKRLETRKKLVRTPRRVPTKCTQTNSTLADTVRIIFGRGRAILDGRNNVDTCGKIDLGMSRARIPDCPYTSNAKGAKRRTLRYIRIHARTHRRRGAQNFEVDGSWL